MPCRRRDCELDHCASCGGHDHEDAPCAEQLVERKHAEWELRMKREAFADWLRKERGAISHEDAFMAGVDFQLHAPNEYVYGNCGQKACHECNHVDEEIAMAERSAGWDPNP